MKYIYLSVMLAVSVVSLTACNTVAGVGEDVGNVGRGVERAAGH